MKTLLYIFVLCGSFLACKQNPQAQKTTSTDSTEISELPGLSIYHLPSTWTTQNNRELQLKDLRGKVLVVSMIYSSCTTACPQLINAMKNIENQLPKEDLKKARFVMVSIDPERDTPERLKELSELYSATDDHWVFLRGTPEDTREFAAVLAVNYKKISPMQFSHSNLISVFDEAGVLVHQKEGLGTNNTKILAAIQQKTGK